MDWDIRILRYGKYTQGICTHRIMTMDPAFYLLSTVYHPVYHSVTAGQRTVILFHGALQNFEIWFHSNSE